MDTPDKDFLNWIADRLVHVYGENGHTDYVTHLRELADKMDSLQYARDAVDALAKALEFPNKIEG